MNAPRDLPVIEASMALLDDRLQQLEAFANQASGAIEQLVNAVVEVQQARPEPAPPAAPMA